MASRRVLLDFILAPAARLSDASSGADGRDVPKSLPKGVYQAQCNCWIWLLIAISLTVVSWVQTSGRSSQPRSTTRVRSADIATSLNFEFPSKVCAVFSQRFREQLCTKPRTTQEARIIRSESKYMWAYAACASHVRSSSTGSFRGYRKRAVLGWNFCTDHETRSLEISLFRSSSSPLTIGGAMVSGRHSADRTVACTVFGTGCRY